MNTKINPSAVANNWGGVLVINSLSTMTSKEITELYRKLNNIITNRIGISLLLVGGANQFNICNLFIENNIITIQYIKANSDDFQIKSYNIRSNGTYTETNKHIDYKQ